jgi:cytochrome P450
MRSLLRWDNLPEVRRVARDATLEGLAEADGTVELVGAVGRRVPLRVVQRYFGFPGPDDATMLRWSKATQSDMFRNPTNDPALHAANLTAGAEMRSWIAYHIEERRKTGFAGDDVVGRLLRMTLAGVSALNVERAISNICGLLVGAIETASQAIVQAVEQILRRDNIATTAKQVAQSGNAADIDPIVWEALRFNPITLLVLRRCALETTIAPGSPHQISVPAGSLIAACTGSAMFDEALFPDPDNFVAGRPPANYLHLGFGHHECLGKYVGLEIIPEAVRQVLCVPGLRLLDGEAGRIHFDGSPFPERFVLGIGSA